MIQVNITTSLKRFSKNYSPNTSIRTILEDNDVRYQDTTILLDGSPLPTGTMDKTLEQLSICEKCYISSIVKASNA